MQQKREGGGVCRSTGGRVEKTLYVAKRFSHRRFSHALKDTRSKSNKPKTNTEAAREELPFRTIQMSSQSRQRSQRKASSLATAAISLQSSDDYRGKGHSSGTSSNVNEASTRNAQNRALTIRERQQIEEEIEERREKDRASKRRKVQRRLDELEVRCLAARLIWMRRM